MRHSGICARLSSYVVICLMLSFSFVSYATAQDKVVVIPLSGEGAITCKGTLVGTRWCNNGDQTVTDMTTGLVWLRFADWAGAAPWRSNTLGDHNDAHTWAGLLEDDVVLRIGIGGYEFRLNDGSVVGDWRLPTKTELYNLANGTEGVKSTNMRAFRGVLPQIYWSSSTHSGENPDIAWLVNLSNGNVSNSTKSYDGGYVWPVRGGS